LLFGPEENGELRAPSGDINDNDPNVFPGGGDVSSVGNGNTGGAAPSGATTHLSGATVTVPGNTGGPAIPSPAGTALTTGPAQPMPLAPPLS